MRRSYFKEFFLVLILVACNWLTTALAQVIYHPDDKLLNLHRLSQLLDSTTSKESHTIRPFTQNTPLQINTIYTTSRLEFESQKSRNLFEFKLADPVLFQSYNTTLPKGTNDGAIWQGKGYNQYVTGGFHLKFTALNIAFRPVLGFTQNQSFQLSPHPVPARLNELSYPLRRLDAVQRFGYKSFTWSDLGDSYVDINLKYIRVGLSNQRVLFGPAMINPLLHSFNAPGFKYARIGTTNPIETPIGGIEFLYINGALEKSDYFDTNTNRKYSSTQSLVVTYQPRFIKGFYIGGNRTYIEDYKETTSEKFKMAGKIFDFFTKSKLATEDNPTGQDPDNQMASLFFRWMFPKNQFELYGEFGRNDHNVDFRDLRMQPDHDRAYLFGFIKLFSFRKDQFLAVNFESTILDATRSSYTRTTSSPASPTNLGITGRWYTHYRQNGFVNKGQILGAGIGSASNSYSLKFDYFNSKHNTSLMLSRISYNNGLLNFQPTYQRIQESNPTGIKRHQLRNIELLISLETTFMTVFDIESSFRLDQSFIWNHNYLKDNDMMNTRFELVLRKRIKGGLR
jgi:hypothetical protein